MPRQKKYRHRADGGDISLDIRFYRTSPKTQVGRAEIHLTSNKRGTEYRSLRREMGESPTHVEREITCKNEIWFYCLLLHCCSSRVRLQASPTRSIQTLIQRPCHRSCRVITSSYQKRARRL